VELLQTASVNGEEELAAIAAHRPEVICVCEFGQLIKEPLLSHYLLLNVHPSLLPRWRGAAPIERTLMAGDTTTGVTIFKIVEGLDSGPMALSVSETVQPNDTAGTLSARLAPLGATLLVAALDRAEAGTLELTEQPEEGATYAHKIEPDDRQLDPARSAVDLERAVRALTPHIGAQVTLPGGKPLRVWSSKVDSSEGEEPEPGQLRATGGRLLFGTADSALELMEVQPPGKRPMPAAAFLRGHSLQ
jgi:methionyl-tRNA formyltransferase